MFTVGSLCTLDLQAMDRELEDVLRGLDELAKQQEHQERAGSQQQQQPNIERMTPYSNGLDSLEHSHDHRHYDLNSTHSLPASQAYKEAKSKAEPKTRTTALHAWTANP